MEQQTQFAKDQELLQPPPNTKPKTPEIPAALLNQNKKKKRTIILAVIGIIVIVGSIVAAIAFKPPPPPPKTINPPDIDFEVHTTPRDTDLSRYLFSLKDQVGNSNPTIIDLDPPPVNLKLSL